MREIVVLSGKGGTGKTTVAAALAERASLVCRVVLVDADVDAANLGLLLAPSPVEEHAFPGGEAAVLDPELCLGCEMCLEVCRFDALRRDAEGPPRIDAIRCEGCGACLDVCPSGALSMERGRGGTWWRSETAFGPLFHAELEPGEENSGRLVSAVRRAARTHADATAADLVLVDGPPGIGCPAIAASTGADLAVVVAEPSLYGAHDLERALDLLEHFEIPALVCVNRADLGPSRTRAIRVIARRRGYAPTVEIPYDEAVIRCVRAGRPVSAGEGGPAAAALTHLWRHVGAAEVHAA